MERYQPYDAGRPAVRLPTHSFVYVQGRWCHAVYLRENSSDGISTFGTIEWDTREVPCEWAFWLHGTQQCLRVKFHYAGDETRARESVYYMQLQIGFLRIWRSPEFGGQFLIQFPTA